MNLDSIVVLQVGLLLNSNNSQLEVNGTAKLGRINT